VFRLRYRVGKRRHSKTVRGTAAEAKRALRELLHSADTGAHVAPERVTVREWIEHWVLIGCPGNKRRAEVGQRSIERYHELLRLHVLPDLGDRPLQQLQADEIDALYVKLESRISPRTARHVHSALNAALGVAVRTGKLARNPMLKVVKVPQPKEANHGTALDQDETVDLVKGFRRSALFAFVAVAAFTGARRNEILALRWTDLDESNKTLSITRAVEETEKFGLRYKAPKTERGRRVITIGDDLVRLLLAERDRHLRIAAGVPEGAPVDLSLVKLPEGALMFPNPPAAGGAFSFIAPRQPRAVTKEFKRKAVKLGFARLRLHDLRGSHSTALLDANVPVHTVAARIGDDPATLLRSYAKRTRKADKSAAEVIGTLAKSALA
jgi:integrase